MARSLSAASAYSSIIRAGGDQLAQLSVSPTDCLTGAQIRLTLRDIKRPLERISVLLICQESYGGYCQQDPIRAYEGSSGWLDAWELIIPVSPEWQGSLESDLIKISWELELEIRVAGVEGGTFTLSLPIRIHENSIE